MINYVGLLTPLIMSLQNIVYATAIIIFAYFLIGFASSTLREIASNRFEAKEVLDLIENTGRILMWFFTVLITLSILGLTQIAASLGTASGFVALGVAYALKDVLADTVAGIYLVNDKDFEIGDKVEVDSSKGTIKQIDLRKSRLELEDGTTKVIRNSDVEKKWIKLD